MMATLLFLEVQWRWMEVYLELMLNGLTLLLSGLSVYSLLNLSLVLI